MRLGPLAVLLEQQAIERHDTMIITTTEALAVVCFYNCT